MNRRSVLGAMVLAAALVSAQAVYAAPATNYVAGHAVSKAKLVKFTLRNDSAATLKVKAGDQEMSLEPGKPVEVKLPAGLQIVTTAATAQYQVGAVVATVSPEYSGNTVVLQ